MELQARRVAQAQEEAKAAEEAEKARIAEIEAAEAAEARALAFLEASKKADSEAAEAEAKIKGGELSGISSGGGECVEVTGKKKTVTMEFNLQIPLGMTLSSDMVVEEVLYTFFSTTS